MAGFMVGGHQCSKIRYRASLGDSMTVTQCYCRTCRNCTSGTFVSYAELPGCGIAFTKGSLSCFKSSDFGGRGFCESCGCHSTIRYCGEREEITNSVWFTVGSMDHPEDIKPTDNIFTSEKLPWLHFDEEPLSWRRHGVDSAEVK